MNVDVRVILENIFTVHQTSVLCTYSRTKQFPEMRLAKNNIYLQQKFVYRGSFEQIIYVLNRMGTTNTIRKHTINCGLIKHHKLYKNIWN